jgi:mannose-6-phosphate isomerase-like protein (cupin superfamily)
MSIAARTIAAAALVVPVTPAAAQRPASIPGGCDAPAAQHQGEAGCWLVATQALGVPSGGPFFWHLYTYPSVKDAEAAGGPPGTIATSYGKVWRYTIAAREWRPAAGERVAVIGPLDVTPGMPYTARYMEALFPPGMRSTQGHRHSGSEAWYVVTGAQCLETPDTLIQAKAGEGALVPQGPAMSPAGVGPETRRSVLLVLHPTAEPWSSPATDWKPLGRCPR